MTSEGDYMKENQKIKEALDDLLGDDEKFADIIYGIQKIIKDNKISSERQEEFLVSLKDVRERLNESSEERIAEVVSKLDSFLGGFTSDFHSKMKEMIDGQTKMDENAELIKQVEEKIDRGVDTKKPKWWKAIDNKKLSEAIGKEVTKNPLKVVVENPQGTVGVKKPSWIKEIPSDILKGITKAIKQTFNVNVINKIEVKKPVWLKELDPTKYVKAIFDFFKNQVLIARLIHTTAKDPVSVRLSNGKDFYNAILSVVGGHGGGGATDPVGLKDSSGGTIDPATQQTLAALLTELKLKADLTETQPVSSEPWDGIEGGPVTVGTTAVELTFSGTTKSISIMADADNTGKIWWGPSTVDSAGTNAYGRLTPDRAVNIDFDDSIVAIYVVSDSASQKVFKVSLQ
jgi:hypothetical protein